MVIRQICCVAVFVIGFIYIADGISVMSVDLGSEWMKIAIVKPGVPMEIALNKESRRKTPLVVSMNGNEREFGDQALNVANKMPSKGFRYFTHLLGKKFDSPAVKTFQKRFPHYKLVEDKERGTVLFQGDNDQLHSVEELLGMILNHTRQIAENYAKHPMKDIVLTVPAYFNQAERRALVDAANMTGLNLLQLMNDNSAVALNYGIFRANTFNSTPKHIMFYDMAASQTTATIVSYSTTKVKDKGYVETVPQVVVKGVGFDIGLGGLEMDIRMRDFLAKEFKKTHKTKKEITENPRAMAKLLKEAKRVRQVLSANTDHMAQVENLFEEKDFRLKVTRAEFEEICSDMLNKVYDPVTMAIKSSAMTMDDIETIILMGGGSRIPKVQELLLYNSGKKELGKSINTDEAAALGAVYRAASLTAGFKVKRFLVKDLNLYPIDVQFERTAPDTNEVRVISRNLYHRLNPLPQKKIMTFNKKPNDFHFNVTYGDLTFLNDEQKSKLSLGVFSHNILSGVDTAHAKHEKATPKGVKAYFNLDESGILHVEKVEAHFEKTPEQVEEEEQSTFAKIGSKLSSFFGSSKTEEETVENKKEEQDESKEGEEKKDTPKEETKKETKTETKEETPKKEKETSKDSEKEKKEEKKDEEKSTKPDDKSNTTSANATDSKTGNKTEEKKPPKPKITKESILVTSTSLDIPSMSNEVLQKSATKLRDLEARDQAKFATEEARSKLESFIYEFKEQLFEESTEKLSTADEREKIEETFNKASEWLDDEGFDADEKTLKDKRKELREFVKDLRFRMKESVERPKAIQSMLQSLNISSMFMDSLAKMSDAKEIYTEKDIADMKKVSEEVKQWFMSTWKKQNASDPTKEPVLLTKDISTYQGKLDREVMYLLNKAKYYVPKPKPKAKVNETASNTTKSNSNTTKTSDESTSKANTTKPETGKSETGKPAEKTKSDKDKQTEETILELPGGESSDDKKSTDKVDKKTEKPDVKTGKESGKTEQKEKETKNKKDGKAHTPEDEL